MYPNLICRVNQAFVFAVSMQGLPQTAEMLTTKDLRTMSGYVECELPNRHLYEFTGNIRVNNLK